MLFAMPAKNRERTPLTELHVSVNFNFMADAVALDGEDPRTLPLILRKTTLAPFDRLNQEGARRCSTKSNPNKLVCVTASTSPIIALAGRAPSVAVKIRTSATTPSSFAASS
jgi:hypothetical protein